MRWEVTPCIKSDLLIFLNLGERTFIYTQGSNAGVFNIVNGPCVKCSIRGLFWSILLVVVAISMGVVTQFFRGAKI